MNGDKKREIFSEVLMIFNPLLIFNIMEVKVKITDSHHFLVTY
jgi:hypothetical protein